MSTVKRIQAEVISCDLLAPDLYKVVLRAPAEEVGFQPGQFMSIAVNGGIRRSYSLSNPPHQTGVFETYADVSPHGPAHGFFAGAVPGQQVDVLFPLGKFVYIPSPEPAYFFATGTGVVPFLSMIRHELETIGSGRELHLYLGVRTLERHIWHDDMLALEAKYANFHYHPYLSQPEPGWGGGVGRITDAISMITDTHIHAYVCGGKVVIDDVERLLLELGVAGESIHYERYY